MYETRTINKEKDLEAKLVECRRIQGYVETLKDTMITERKNIEEKIRAQNEEIKMYYELLTTTKLHVESEYKKATDKMNSKIE